MSVSGDVIDNQIWDGVRNSVYITLYSSVCYTAYHVIWDKVCSSVDGRIYNVINDSIGYSVNHSVQNAIREYAWG